MRLCLVLFACGLALGAARATAGQTINLEPVRDLLAHAPTLGAREIEQVLQASREAIAGKTFRFTPLAGTPGPAHQMDAAGRLRFVRNEIPDLGIIIITEFTRRQARYCDGSASRGDLIVDYRRSGDGWSATARQSAPFEPMSPIFAMLAGHITVQDAGRTRIGDRPARGLTGRWKPPAAMDVEERLASGETARFQVFPSNPGVETTETLWVDEKSLLPLRIEMTVEVRGSGSAAQVQSFDYETGPDLGPPKGVKTLDCIDSAR